MTKTAALTNAEIWADPKVWAVEAVRRQRQFDAAMEAAHQRRVAKAKA